MQIENAQFMESQPHFLGPKGCPRFTSRKYEALDPFRVRVREGLNGQKRMDLDLQTDSQLT